jgi:flagellar hook-associated protein 1 FlgK
MGSSILGIGISALSAAQAALVTTEHNISNVNTPGFRRQQITQSAALPQFTGSGFFGKGVQVDTVKRIYSQFLDSQVLQAQTQAKYYDSYSLQINQIDNLLADPTAGLSPALQDFFAGVSDVSANPDSAPSRQSLLSSAQTLATRFQSINQRLTEIRDGVNSQITSVVTEINSYAQQLADLNQKIALAQSSSSGQQPANDLLDQRDQLVAELNQRVRVSVITQSDGSYNIFIGNGQSLVVGDHASALSVQPSLEDPSRLDLAYQLGSASVPINSSSLTGGTLGGLLVFRSTSLDSAQNALGRVAIGLGQTFNNQHRLGQDLNGALGGDFFNVGAPNVISYGTNNAASTISASITDAKALTTSDYRFAFDGTNYTLTRLSDNTAVSTTTAPTAGTPLTLDGVSVTAATINAGETFLIQPTRNGARDLSVAISDTARIAAAAPIRTNAASANLGSGQISAGSVNPPPPPNANLQDNVAISFIDATHFSVTDTTTSTVLAASVVYDPSTGATLTYNGWTATIGGEPSTGDTFTVGPNTSGVSDNRNALLLAALQTSNTLAGGATSYQGAYSQLVNEVGNKAREVDVNGKAQAALVTQTQQLQQSVSGVNLDEEAANLVRYQQSYQAAGRMIQISSSLFQTLLDATK